MSRVTIIVLLLLAGVVAAVALGLLIRHALSPAQRRLRRQRRSKRQYLRAGMAHLEKPTNGSDVHPGGGPNVL